MAAPGSGIVFVSGSQAPGTAVAAFTRTTSLSLDQLAFACASTQPPAAVQYQAALVIPSADAPVTSATLAAVAKVLVPGAAVYVHAQDQGSTEQVQKELLLGGFLDAQVLQGVCLVQAQKPTWEVGAKAALTLKRPAATATVAQAWKLAAEDDDMVDEDELLTEEDKQKLPTVTAPASDCSTSKKACANCSCGRAEAEAAGQKVELTQEMLDNPQTNCGSCALGDAFRCAGCPYRGLPAFEPGKKITLGKDFLTADA